VRSLSDCDDNGPNVYGEVRVLTLTCQRISDLAKSLCHTSLILRFLKDRNQFEKHLPSVAEEH